jgi:hypothetical protein
LDRWEYFQFKGDGAAALVSCAWSKVIASGQSWGTILEDDAAGTISTTHFNFHRLDMSSFIGVIAIITKFLLQHTNYMKNLFYFLKEKK